MSVHQSGVVTKHHVVFIERPVRVEFRGGNVHVFDYFGTTVLERVMSISDYRASINLGNEGLAAFDLADGGNVIPLCELCVRHNLPRMGGDGH